MRNIEKTSKLLGQKESSDVGIHAFLEIRVTIRKCEVNTACNSDWGPGPGARIKVLAKKKDVAAWRVDCHLRLAISVVSLEGSHHRQAETIELRALISNI